MAATKAEKRARYDIQIGILCKPINNSVSEDTISKTTCRVAQSPMHR